MEMNLTDSQLDEFSKLLSTSTDVKQINENKTVKIKHSDGKIYYSLWLSEILVSFSVCSFITIAAKKYLSILFSHTLKEFQRKGYSQELIWELHLIIEEPIYIGGSFTTAGEGSTVKLANYLEKIRSIKLKMIDNKSGEILDYDNGLLMKKPKIGLLIESAGMFEAFTDAGLVKFWLNDNIDFSET